MLKKILITGGVERENGFELGQGKFYKAGKLFSLNLENDNYQEHICFDQANENYPEEHPNLLFTAACYDDDLIWIPTHGEVIAYRLHDWKIIRRFSIPLFNNNHSVIMLDNKLYVTATGTDMVVIMDKDVGKSIECINIEGKDIWHRFEKQIDYRKIHSTKPHQGHPNYVFKLKDEIWVTRCGFEDAACLTDVKKNIKVTNDKEMSIHDGFVYENDIYFTSVDGHILVADQKSLKIKNIYNLNKGVDRINKGWCRGLYIEDGLAYVGFSKIRKTRNARRLEWLKKSIKRNNENLDSAVVVFDLNKQVKIKEIAFEEGVLDAIYSILPY